ncbi:recombination protein RecT [Virgibacillus subterraneus]|uniref:Recombination protein RecT n=1 Tax=Virgibacillus subterraneus TaxID=621109 RepID=A0A1H8YZK7_9BACI|nr:recombinase RecT [Virgibacillus subterraneus]SEP57556.1 recombination protein RecT [Virgibacillus subterraneus]
MSKNELAMIKKDTVDVVAEKVKQFQEQGELRFPANYSPENAMKSAWLTLQSVQDKNRKPALEVCTRDSVANALLDMVVQGLNPNKKQGYFIVYGQTLTFQRSYFGTMAVTKQVSGARTIDAAVIYEGDDVDYEMNNGRIVNLTHKQKFVNIDKEKMQGAYATIVFSDDNVYHEIMTIEEIRQAWSKAQFWSKGAKKEKEGSTHDEFKQEMAKKTVINRACKKFLNSSNDSSLMLDHFNRQDESVEEAKAQEEISENANSEVIDIEYNDSEPEAKDNSEQKEGPKEEPDPEQTNVDDVMNDMEQQESQESSRGF